MEQPTIVYLDAYTLNPGDLDWSPIAHLGHFTRYEFTEQNQVVERAKDADIVLVNKALLTKEIIEQLPQLKCICVTATGYNNVDLQAARAHHIPVCNAVGYSTPAVAQQVFALLMAMTNRVEKHSQSAKSGDWAAQKHFAYWLSPLDELAGKTMGIYGLGRIGQSVAQIALALGMQVLATHKHPQRDAMPGVRFVDLATLFRESDAISLHAPLSEQNFEIVNRDLLSTMKPGAYLINTGRGGLVQEQDLYEALSKNWIKGAALDVLQVEPPTGPHPLFELENCIITPHHAWATVAARGRLMQIVADNIQAFLDGAPVNVVN